MNGGLNLTQTAIDERERRKRPAGTRCSPNTTNAILTEGMTGDNDWFYYVMTVFAALITVVAMIALWRYWKFESKTVQVLDQYFRSLDFENLVQNICKNANQATSATY